MNLLPYGHGSQDLIASAVLAMTVLEYYCFENVPLAAASGVFDNRGEWSVNIGSLRRIRQALDCGAKKRLFTTLIRLIIQLNSTDE